LRSLSSNYLTDRSCRLSAIKEDSAFDYAANSMLGGQPWVAAARSPPCWTSPKSSNLIFRLWLPAKPLSRRPSLFA